MNEKRMLSEETILQITPVEAKHKIIMHLNAASIYTLEDLLNTSRSELRGCPGIGRLALLRIEAALKIQNRSLPKRTGIIAKSTGVSDRRYR